jgi:hypothetical protein
MFALHEQPGSTFLRVDVELMAEGLPGHAMKGRDGIRACGALQWPTSGCSTRETEMNGREGCCSGGRGDLQSPKDAGNPGALDWPMLNCGAPARRLDKE